MAKLKVLVVGDLILDQYNYCSSTKLTPDEERPVYDVNKSEFCLGGAANVANNLNNLGVEVFLIGVLGKDDEAEIFKKLMVKTKICTDYILMDQKRTTTFKTRIINDNQFLFRIDREEISEIDQETENKIKVNISKIVKNVDACVISDYQKGVLSKKLCRYLIGLFKKNHKPVFVDPKGKDYSKYEGCTVITPNQKELVMATKMGSGNKIPIIKEATMKLFNMAGCSNLIVTIGSKGMLLVNKSEIIHSPAFKVKKVNASGAGDTAISAIVVAYLNDKKWREILRWSNYLCSMVIQEENTSVLNPRKVPKLGEI